MKLIEFDMLTQTLGWVLLHSLWQGLLVYLLYFVLKSVNPVISSARKYALAVASLALILLSSTITFFILLGPSVPGSTLTINMINAAGQTSLEAGSPSPPLWIIAGRWINRHLQHLVEAWTIGILFFGGRLFIAGWSAHNLRRHADPVAGIWERRLEELAATMGIRKVIAMAQSRWVDSPILLGYIKPLILLPVGLLSGLTTDQIEAILLHELAHVKRSDYLINFTQSVMEVLFFFNPFVWILSAQIRNGREQCCDDMVVKRIHPSVYATALYKLAEAPFTGAPLALAATGSKMELLYRIKRIMEPMNHKKETPGKAIPAFVVIALILAAGLLAGAYLPEQTSKSASSINPLSSTAADTTVKKLKKGRAARSPEKSTAREEPSEGFYGDAPRQPIGPFDIGIAMPEIGPVPEVDFVPEIGSLEALHVDIDFPDTLPGLPFPREQWSAFEKEFTEKFREHFGDFYKNNQPEFEKMMKELEDNTKRIREEFERHSELEMSWSSAEMARAEIEMQRAQEELKRTLPHQEAMMRAQEEAMAEMAGKMKLQSKAMELQMKMLEQQHKQMEQQMKSFEKELTEQLLKDGYLEKNEVIKNINWDGDDMTVNGKKIKDSDKAKYRDLHEKYFKERGRFRYEE